MPSLIQVDIFATKGIEYILVIFFLAALVLFWRLLNRPQVGAVATARAPGMWNHWFNLREGLFYHQGHVWAAPEGKDIVRIGLDDFAQRLVGEPSSIDVPSTGHRLEQGERGGRLKVGGRFINFLSPVGGEVQEVNGALRTSPGLVNRDPYGEGWLMKVRVPNMTANLRNLLSGRLAKAWMDEAVQRLHSRVTGELGTVMQDGGAPVTGMARHISDEDWDKLAEEFLLSG
jgi:glycine cleavage system H lipoate-binding protein